MSPELRNAPKPSISMLDAMGLTIGIVVGAGIFATPSLVAASSNSATTVMLAWALGGLISIAGALAYAELSAAYPHAGGDYHFLMRAFGPRVAFLFGWARITVIQTGSIAFLAFVFGDYASGVVPLGPQSSVIYALIAVAVLTGLNILGVREGTRTQNILTAVEVLGVILVIGAGLSVTPAAAAVAAAPASASASSAFGLMMVFVLLTYGGWNEAAYISAELHEVQRNIVRVLVGSLLLVTFLYLAINGVYLHALGLGGAAQSSQIAADLMRKAMGEPGAVVISILVAIASLTSANASIMTGARSAYALGRDVPAFAILGRWDGVRKTPVVALYVQGFLTVALVLFGAYTRGSSINESALRTMIDYTAPVFWLFFLLTGVALFVLRRREPQVERPFRVPLFPITPIAFCVAAAYLLYSSLNYVRSGAIAGLIVLASGVLVMLVVKMKRKV
jgi:basic amino acid/polyamine antiporter, APA family